MVGLGIKVVLRRSMIPFIISSLLLLSREVSAADSSRKNNYNVVDSVSNLSYDENGRLASHTLITLDGKCAELMVEDVDSWHGFEFQAVTGPAEIAYFGAPSPPMSSLPLPPINSREDCPAVCLERGVEKSLITAVLPSRRYNRRQQPFTDWFREGCRIAEFCVANFQSREDSFLNMYWWSPWKEEWLFREKIGYGSGHLKCANSSIGHVFLFQDDDTKEIVSKYTIEYTSTIPIGKPAPFVKGDTNFTKVIEETLHREWRKHTVVKRTFSPLGFAKGRLPPDIFGNMGAFYYNNRNHIYLETAWGEGKGNGVFVNWWEYDVYFLQAPKHCKLVWQEALRQLVEDWIGEPVEQTAMYGMRRYETGARLLTHVDRIETHAASLIVNIAQGNIEEPWQVEVHDHSGRLHQISMDPGDVVYYESASCLHGRNTPLKGENAYYVNLFTHYRPVGDPDWWQKENTANTPEPVGDDIGECTVQQKGNHPLPVVTCENPSIGRYLSPSMFTATSGTDLLHWWRSVAPPNNNSGKDGEEL